MLLQDRDGSDDQDMASDLRLPGGRGPGEAGHPFPHLAHLGHLPGLPALDETNWGYCNTELPEEDSTTSAHARVQCVLDHIELTHTVNLYKKDYRRIVHRHQSVRPRRLA